MVTAGAGAGRPYLALSFKPDVKFKRQRLLPCKWEEVVRQSFPEEPE